MPTKYIPLLVLFALFVLASCSPGTDLPPQPTQTPLPPPFGLTYCDIDPADICLVGFGLDIEERLLILFNVEKPLYTNIYIRSDGPEGEILFQCLQSKNFPENVYCLGEPYPAGELIKLKIYSKSSNKFIAIGIFGVQISDLPDSDVVFYADGTPTPDPSYPNPTYPNPSYPNPSPSPTPTPTP